MLFGLRSTLLFCQVLYQVVCYADAFGKYGQSEMSNIVAEAVASTMKDRPKSSNGQYVNMMAGQEPDSVMMYHMFGKYQGDKKFVENVGRCADIVVRATHIMASRGHKRFTKEEFQRELAPFCPKRFVHCDPKFGFRSPDGSCNNLKNPLLGASMTGQSRFVPPAYGDRFNLGLLPRINSVLGGALPNPRDISNTIHYGGITPPRSRVLSHVVAYFGQFAGHDMVSNPNIQKGNSPSRCCMGNTTLIRPECFSFSTPPGEFKTTCMNFVRTEFTPEPGCPPGGREQVNQATSYLDLSVTYGNSLASNLQLRDVKSGRLQEGPGGLLPDGPSEQCMGRSMCFRAGDARHTETPTLASIQTVFLREHNRLVEILRKINPHWDGERLYQEARKINVAVYQHIIYNEFLPIILGEQAVKTLGLLPKPTGFSTCYSNKVDGSTKNAFSAAAFRYGHSMIGRVIQYFDSNFISHMRKPLKDEYFNPTTVRDNRDFGIDRMLRWVTSDMTSVADRFLASSVRNHLFQSEPDNGFDLSALNIQRGRDHGLPPYNKFRMFCGLPPALTFGTGANGLDTHDPAVAKSLGSTYKHPDDIDLFVGGLSELPMKGSIVGPTFGCLIGNQFRNYKCGDRFYYENNFHKTGFTKDQMAIIKRQTLSAVFCRTSNIAIVQRNSFKIPKRNRPRVQCQDHPQLGERELIAWRGI